MNKYGWQFKERVLFRLGNMTEAPIDNEVTVRHNKCNDWWFKHRERKATNCPAKPADEDDKDSEYVYEVEDGVLKVYRVTLEKVYKIKQPKAEPKSSDFLAGLAEGVRLNNGVEDAS